MKLPAAYDVLKQLAQWVGYKTILDDVGKVKKIPVNPHTGQWAKADDVATWGTFAEAEAAVARYKLNGLGIEFGSGVMGVDLDHCIADDGSLTDFASTIVAMLDSYTEFSPSGTGLHILLKTTAPEGTFGVRNDKIRLEMYDKGRFFTITGKVFGEEKPIRENMEKVQEIYDAYLKKVEKPSTQKKVETYSTESARELWEKAFASANGDKIRELHNGNWNGYDSQSSADLALLNYLAYWTNGDPVKMDEMFRQTGLMRPKWDERRGAQTYGAMSIEKARKNFRQYEKGAKPDAQPKEQLPASKDPEPVEQIPETNPVNETDAPIQPETSIETGNEPVEPSQPETVKVSVASLKKKYSDNVFEYYQQGGLIADLAKFRGVKERKTGFANIDKKIGCLYPGLYMLGAMPGLGKTTFMHQMADQLATAGEHVLYFSLEQTQLEIFTKGLSRTTAQQHFTDFDPITETFRGAVSAIDIRRGKGIADPQHADNNEFCAAVDYYVESIKTESIIQCNFETTIETIIEYVEKYIAEKSVKPVVIVDYLQIIRPVDVNYTTKDAVDGVTRALKLMQSRNDLVVVAICALNRGGYITPLDFESFRETSGIEYTADVVWGLQLQAIHEDVFNKQNQVKSRRDRVSEEMGKVPRKIEFVCLKNRYGQSRWRRNFDYFSAYDLFVPEDNFIDITAAAGNLPFDNVE